MTLALTEKQQNITRNLRVERIIYFNKESKWGVIATSPKDIKEDNLDLINKYGNITVSGNMEGVYEGAFIFVEGQILVHEKYGKQINAGFVKVLADDKSKEGIVNFLTKSHIKGISTQNAKKIYDEFRENSIEIVLHSPHKLINIRGISTKTIEKVQESVDEYLRHEGFYKYCSKIGIEYSLQKKLLEAFGDQAFNIVQLDPFRILEVSDDFSFKVVDNIYLENGGSPTGQKRLSTGLIYSLKHLAILEGSTGCSRRRLDSAFYKLLKLDSSEGYFQNTLEILKGQGKIVEDVDIIYLKEYTDSERYIAERLISLENNNVISKEINEEVVKEEIKDFPFVLNEEQVRAVHACLCHKVAVLTGAAGCITGDTIIRYNRASLGRKATVEHLYRGFNGLPIKYSKGWNKTIPTRVRSYIESEDRIMLNDVEDIVYSGKKEVYKLTLEDGKTLKATADHKIMTKNGFVKLIELNKGDLVMIDNLTRYMKKDSHSEHKQRMDKRFNVGQYHPYASHRVKKDTYWIQQYRAIYEANLNGLTLEQYREETKKKDNKLKYTDPQEYHIHHKDGNHHNNVLSNLELIKAEDHKKMHGDYSSFGHGVPEYSPVKSISYVGIEDTYDICCYENHNFNANGMIISNSGKSSITKALYRIYERSGYQVVLLSPTAKAGRRLEECTGGIAQTVHKFLGMKKDSTEGDSFEYSPNTVIVVDEASMLDIILCKNLVANATSTTKFLLVGDNNQLPSVQVGNVLGDLIDSQKIHVSLLTDVVRQAENSNIIKYCTMINKGKVIEPCEHEDFIYEEFGTSEELKDKFLPLYLKEVKNFSLNEVQVITPYKKGEIGMDNLNRQLQMRYNKNPEIDGFEPYRIGDRVRHIKNNYNKEVFNGETGVIREVKEDMLNEDEKELIVDYGNKEISYTRDDINELTLSYCSTVHASQGSEYKVVFVILDDTSVNNFLYIRRLLYTAVSRGKKKVYIFTKPYLVDVCIQNDTYRPRVTKLKDYLRDMWEII